MRGSNQGGSLAGFIVIGAFLVLVLAGGLYGLNRYNAEQQKKQEIAQQEEDQPSSTDKKAATSESKSGAPSSGSDNSNSSEKSTSATDSSSSSSQNSGQTKTGQTGTDQLPQTGPADGLLNIVAITLLSFAVVSYLQSRAYVRQRSLR